MKAVAAFVALILLAGILFGQSFPGPGTPHAAAVVTRYYGYGCNGTTTNTCTVGGTPVSALNYLLAIPITTGSHVGGYTVVAGGANFSLAPGTSSMQFAIYDSAGSSSPVSGCTASASTVASTGWQEDTNFSGCTLAASTTYKVAFELNNTNSNFQFDTGVGTRYYTTPVTFGTFPSGVTFTSDGNSHSFYVRVTEN